MTFMAALLPISWCGQGLCAVDEARLKSNHIELADGSASDIGLASISGALYRNHDCLIICYDNEQYANTGIQASSRTPYGGMTTFSPPGPLVPEGKKLFPKDLARMMAAGHPHCYVATASVGYPIDLMNKVRKGLNHKGAAYLMVYTPCQKGFVYETPRSIDLGRLVVECGLYPIRRKSAYRDVCRIGARGDYRRV